MSVHPIFILVSIWSGVIIFFSAVVAPTVFKSLEEREAGVFLRAFFPKYYIFGILLGVASVAILMFMPIEGAYMLACDDDMVRKASTEKIAIVGPTTLIAILQIISRIWSSKRQSEATNEIIRAATDIYDKTRLVGEAFEEFEKHLEQANKSIASGKSRTKNLVSKVEKMRTIGGLEPIKDISDKLKVIDKD